jgi:hypothetical protein
MDRLAELGTAVRATAGCNASQRGAPASIKRRHHDTLDGTQLSPPVGGIRRNAVSGRIKDHPTGKVGRVRVHFNVSPTRALNAFDGLTDSRDGRDRIIRQPRGCEMVIVQRDGCVKPQMCHVMIIGELAYLTVNRIGYFPVAISVTANGSKRRS